MQPQSNSRLAFTMPLRIPGLHWISALPVVLPLLALGLAFALTEDEVAIHPRLPVLAGAALLFALLAGPGGGRPRRWIDFPLAAVLGLAAGHLLFAPGLPYGHDTISHLWGSWAAFREVQAGDLFPRWLHHVGMGEPLLQFYGPAGFFAMLPFSLAGLSSARALSAGFLALGAIAAMAMYAVVARWTGDRRAGLVAAAAYAFAPYRLLDSNYRVALGESTAMALLPLVLFGAVEVARGSPGSGRRRLVLAAFATASADRRPPPDSHDGRLRSRALACRRDLPMAVLRVEGSSGPARSGSARSGHWGERWLASTPCRSPPSYATPGSPAMPRARRAPVSRCTGSRQTTSSAGRSGAGSI